MALKPSVRLRIFRFVFRYLRYGLLGFKPFYHLVEGIFFCLFQLRRILLPGYQAKVVKHYSHEGRLYCIKTPGCLVDKALLYMHGGGFLLGSIWTYIRLMVKLGRESGFVVYFLDYSLAPKARFPVAQLQMVAAYRYLLQIYHPKCVAFGGDSAGGNLCLATLFRLRAAGEPLPAAVFLDSPFLDLSFSGESWQQNRKAECVLPLGFESSQRIAWFYQKVYLGQASPLDPLVSPLFGDLRGLPPIHLSYSEKEVLTSDGESLAKRLRELGEGHEIKVFSMTPHANIVFFYLYPEGMLGLRAIVNFLKARVH